MSDTSILQSTKNKTLFTPACELECQYITFDIFYNGPNVIFYIGLKCTFEVKECMMINILYALKQLKNKFHTHVLSHFFTFNLVCLWYNLTCESLFKSIAELLKLENYVNFLLSCNNFA